MDVILYGAGGHAKTVIATIEDAGEYRIHCILDDDPGKQGRKHYGVDVVGGGERLSEPAFRDIKRAFVAIGDNQSRAAGASKCLDQGYELITVVHPSVVTLRGALINAGAVVFANAVIGSDAEVGSNAIVSIGSIVGHDVRVGEYGHVAPNVSLNGGAVVGAYSFIGTGSIILPNVQVGDHVIVGANTLVTEDLPSGVTAVGSPARIIKRRDHE